MFKIRLDVLISFHNLMPDWCTDRFGTPMFLFTYNAAVIFHAPGRSISRIGNASGATVLAAVQGQKRRHNSRHTVGVQGSSWRIGRMGIIGNLSQMAAGAKRAERGYLPNDFALVSGI